MGRDRRAARRDRALSADAISAERLAADERPAAGPRANGDDREQGADRKCDDGEGEAAGISCAEKVCEGLHI